MKITLIFVSLFISTSSFAGNAGGGGTNGIVASFDFDVEKESVLYLGEDVTYTYFKHVNVGSLFNKSANFRLERQTSNSNADRYLDALDESKKQNDWINVK